MGGTLDDDDRSASTPTGHIVLGLAALSWVTLCVGSCLGMGYLGCLFAGVALVVAYSSPARSDEDRLKVRVGVAIAIAHLVFFVLLIGALVIGAIGLLATAP